MRLKKGQVEDFEDALDLEKMARVVDRVQEVFEEFSLSADEALWASALSYLGTFNSTDDFASTELLVVAARAHLREAGDVFESLPTEEEGNAIPGLEEEEEGEDDEDGDGDGEEGGA